MTRKTAEQRMDDFPTDSFINFLNGASNELYIQIAREVFEMHMHLRSPVKKLKKYLGKQDYTWNGSCRRKWVWESKTQLWRVYADNDEGVSFEVKANFTHAEALEAWADFSKRIQLPPISETTKRMFK